MKKIISLFIIVILFSSFAAAINPAVGNVVESGKGVDNAYVVVNCNSIVKTTYSNVKGTYGVGYLNNECPDGSMVYVEAFKGPYYGKNSGMMYNTIDISISMIDVFLFKIIEIIKQVRTFRKITIPHINTNEIVKAGNYLDVSINIENSGNKNTRDITVTAVIPELALRKSVRISKLKKGRDTTREIKLFIPSYTKPGVYDLRITINDQHTRRVKHRSFRVV